MRYLWRRVFLGNTTSKYWKSPLGLQVVGKFYTRLRMVSVKTISCQGKLIGSQRPLLGNKKSYFSDKPLNIDGLVTFCYLPVWCLVAIFQEKFIVDNLFTNKVQ